ncbi:hypothetical protein, partial [Pantoea ananatis]|uniref:hypothetical protein n=1 Tax=Pantoea ananas TaxID=553 RepID=UPI001B311B38
CICSFSAIRHNDVACVNNCRGSFIREAGIFGKVFSGLNACDKARTWGCDRFLLLNAPINGTFTLSCRVFFIRYTLVQTGLDIVIHINQEPV